MLVPFAGGAEKMVVTLLTMVICPLYIPSIWGLFSKRLTGNQLIYAMAATWAIGLTARFTIPASVLNPSMIDSISGCVLPVLILSGMELWSRRKGLSCPGYDEIATYTDPEADTEPDERMKEATRRFSQMAISIFCITLGAIALLLVGLLIARDPRTMAVSGIVVWFVAAIAALTGAYVIYRIADSRR